MRASTLHLSRSTLQRDRGSMLVGLMLSIVVGGLSLVTLSVSTSAQRSARFDRDYHAAIQVADAGLQDAVARLRTDLSADDAPEGTVYGGGPQQGTTEDGSYEWEAVKTDDGWDVTTAGTIGTADRKVVGQVEQMPAFEYGAFSDGIATFRGTSTSIQSYNSALGDHDTGNGRAGTNTHVDTNGQPSMDELHLFNDSDCDGGGCDVPTFGYPYRYEIDPSLVTDAMAEDCVDGSGNPTNAAVTWAGTVTLDGTPVCATSLDVANDTAVVVDSPTVVYVTQDLTFGNKLSVNCPTALCGSVGPIANGPVPGDLLFLTLGEQVTFKPTNAGPGEGIAAGIYAPYASCGGTASNTILYGSLVCSSINIGGSYDIWFDDAIVERLTRDLWEVGSWRED